MGPNDVGKIEQMRRLTQEIDRRLEIFLGAKFERVLSLADRANFDELVTEEVIDELKSHYDIQRGTFVLSDDTYDTIRDRLYTALCELRSYTEDTPREEYMPKFLNKLNIVGSWTKRIWDDKGNTRRALRALGDIVFEDDNILSWLKKNERELPISTQEALREFSKIGCYSIAAHPWLEISKGDIEKGKFIELAAEMAQEGVLQGAGRGWKDDRTEVDAMIDHIASLSKADFRKDGSNPDFHGPARTDIRRGERLASDEYAQDGEEPDREGYFIETDFFADKYLGTIRELIKQGKYEEAVNLIRIVGNVAPYGNSDEEMLQILLDRLVEYSSSTEIGDRSKHSSAGQADKKQLEEKGWQFKQYGKVRGEDKILYTARKGKDVSFYWEDKLHDKYELVMVYRRLVGEHVKLDKKFERDQRFPRMSSSEIESLDRVRHQIHNEAVLIGRAIDKTRKDVARDIAREHNFRQGNIILSKKVKKGKKFVSITLRIYDTYDGAVGRVEDVEKWVKLRKRLTKEFGGMVEITFDQGRTVTGFHPENDFSSWTPHYATIKVPGELYNTLARIINSLYGHSGQSGHPAFAFNNMPQQKFTLKEYCSKTKVPISTARRDFQVLEELELVAIRRPSRGKSNEIECIIPEDLKLQTSQILGSYRDRRDIPKIKLKILNMKSQYNLISLKSEKQLKVLISSEDEYKITLSFNSAA